MKALVAALAIVTAGLLGLPLLAGSGAAPAVRVGMCGELAVILDTIRTLESGGDYQAQAAGSTASGAYQFIDSTWASLAAQAGHLGYPRAWQAPPAVQDAVAAEYVQSILDSHGGDIAYVPLTWYYPAAIGNAALMDIVPYPDAGNVLTPRQYQQRWLDLYGSKHGAARTCAPVIGGAWALPVPRELLDRNPALVDAPHHDYPAWDFPAATGTPIYAIQAGTVASVSGWPSNCYGNSGVCVDKCGLGVVIDSGNGIRWTYCHASQLNAAVGDQITAGQQIMLSGNTGHSSGPHLHLGLRINGTDRCPQPILRDLLGGRPPSTVDREFACSY